MTRVTPAIPMTTATTLLEPSFSDLITAIEQANDLPGQQRRHWVCSLRRIAKWLNRPPAVIPARSQALRFSVGQLHHARIDVTPKTLANHKSNVWAALRWFKEEYNVPQHGMRLSPDWARFYKRLDTRLWERVSSLVRYCSARGIRPSEVSDEVFGRYWDYRAETTRLPTHNTKKRFMIRAWNSYAATNDTAWVLQRLTEPRRSSPLGGPFPQA